ncbi:MAG: hypothetical protein JW820_06475 [Spirochaetales bacterium]|nr:hypothetical protein [Spirochaetales bacterium]
MSVMNVAGTEDLERKLIRYLWDVLGVRVEAEPWAEAERLPLFLRDSYGFSRTSLLGTPLLLMMDKGSDALTPASIAKQVTQVQRRWSGEVVYVSGAIDSHNRRRLVQQKTPFAVPGNQLYLPVLGVDLREYFRRSRALGPSFTPSTQATLLYALNTGLAGPVSPLELSERLKYTPMTMTRAFDELQDAGIGEHSVRGKRRLWELNEPAPACWQKARRFLRSPVLRRTYVNGAAGPSLGPYAGLTALSQYTDLAGPGNPVIATCRSAWTRMRSRTGLAELQTPDPHSTEVELWSYRPDLTARAGKVDRLSLFLSLDGTVDERIEVALEDLLDGMRW